MIAVAVCVVNYNTCSLLSDCIQSVLAEQPCELIVVDNGSQDGSAEMVAKNYPSVKLIHSSQNRGFGAAANLGVHASQADVVMLLNSDTILKPGALLALRSYLEAHPKAGMVGPQIAYPDGSHQTSCFHFPKPLHMFLYLSGLYQWIPRIPLVRSRSLQTRHEAAAVPWVLGAAVAFRREAFEAAGGFDESFFLYFEEVDLSYRTAQLGWETHFAPVTQVIHIGGASTGQEPAAMSVQYFVSLAQFYRKHYSVLQLLALILLVKAVALLHLGRNMLMLQVARDKELLEALKINIQVSQSLLMGKWHREALGY